MPTKPQAEVLQKLADGWEMHHLSLYSFRVDVPSRQVHWRVARNLAAQGWIESVFTSYTISEEGFQALERYNNLY